MAMLATLEGLNETIYQAKTNAILSACLGACYQVGAIVRGCLGATIYQDWEPGLNAITDENERYLAGQKAYYRGIEAKTITEQGIRNGQFKNMEIYGGWFYPIQEFILMFNNSVIGYPELNDEEISTKTYYTFLATYPKPADYEKAAIYDKKINALREFINGKGWFGGIHKTELYQRVKGQGAAAAESASAAAQAYKKAMEQREIEAAEIAEKAAAEAMETEQISPQTETATETTAETKTSILPIALAAAAALAFLG